jgi:threonine dehydrogenase-like Zn-dependent dehydrogenase
MTLETMLGIKVPGDREVEVVDVPIPEPAYDEALIEIHASGLCGSDLPPYARPRPPEPDMRGRVVSGHEPSGVIAAVGPGVTEFQIGDRVFAYHISGCGSCHQCRLGYMVNCTSPARAAYGQHRDGGNARFMTATARTLVALPDSLTFSDGSMLACTAGTAYGACVRANISARDTVFIAGLGPVGLTLALTAVAHGAQVIVADTNAERVKFADGRGVAHAVQVGQDTPEVIASLTQGLGPTVAVDCSGSDAGRLLCLEVAGTWSRVVFVGYGGRSLTFDPGALVLQKQLTLIGSSVCSIGQMEDAAQFFAEHAVHPSQIVRGEYPLTEGSRVYREFAGGAPGKFVFTPGG